MLGKILWFDVEHISLVEVMNLLRAKLKDIHKLEDQLMVKLLLLRFGQYNQKDLQTELNLFKDHPFVNKALLFTFFLGIQKSSVFIDQVVFELSYLL